MRREKKKDDVLKTMLQTALKPHKRKKRTLGESIANAIAEKEKVNVTSCLTPFTCLRRHSYYKEYTRFPHHQIEMTMLV